MNVSEVVCQAARKYSGHTALEYYGETWTFRDLLERVESFVGSLGRWELKSGDRVAIWLGDRPDTVFLYLASIQRDLTALIIDGRCRAQEAAVLLSTPVDALIYHSSLAPVVAEALNFASRPKLLVECCDDGAFHVSSSSTASVTRQAAPKEDPDAMIIPTSGTSGAPRLVRLTHQNIVSNLQGLEERVAGWLMPGDVFLNFLPLAHSYGLLGATLLPWLEGCKVVLRRGFNPLEMWDLLASHHVSFFAGVPAVYALLLTLPAPEPLHISLKAACCGSDLLSPAIKRAFEARFSAPLVEGYSLTEATVVTTMNSPGDPREGSTGQPLREIQVKIINDEGQALPVGEVGEIILQGPTVMRGYIRSTADKGKEIRQGWLHTEDLGSLDAENRLRIVGRKSDLIAVGGEKVYPKEVEDVCRRFPGVLDVAVVGIPDEWMGQRPIACVVMAQGTEFDPHAIVEHCGNHLTKFKVPSRVIPFTQIPRSGMGKILRTALRIEIQASSSAAKA